MRTLGEKRVLGDREYSWREAQEIIMDMKMRGKTDESFLRYFRACTDHPEYEPDYFSLLRVVLPIDKEEGEQHSIRDYRTMRTEQGA